MIATEFYVPTRAISLSYLFRLDCEKRTVGVETNSTRRVFVVVGHGEDAGAELGVGEELAHQAPEFGVGEDGHGGFGGGAAAAHARDAAFFAQGFHLFDVVPGREALLFFPLHDELAGDAEGFGELARGAAQLLAELLDVVAGHGATIARISATGAASRR